MSPDEFVYRLDSPARGLRPGAHRSLGGDSGLEFRGHVALKDAPDPRRLDLLASLRDPFGHDNPGAWRVRLYRQRMAVPVWLVADASASMGFTGAQRRLDVLAQFAQGLARSVWKLGDRFGAIAGAERLLDAPRLAPSRAAGLGEPLAQALRALPMAGPGTRDARALAGVAAHLGRQRALVFLASDFHWPDDLLDAVLGSLALHQVVPVVLWDAQEFAPAAAPGLLPLADAERGERRLVWWRPALRARWQAAGEARRAALRQRFAAHRCRGLFIDGAFRGSAVTRHFQS